jgi:hypothetical protein
MTKHRSTVIMSRDLSHKAVLVPTGDGNGWDGCWVTISRVKPPMRTYGNWFVRGAFHLIRDQVHDIIWPMTPDDSSTLVWDADLRRVIRRRNNVTPGSK